MNANRFLALAAWLLLAGAAQAIPTSGLVFRLDASDRAHILTNETGYVTNWLSSACDPNYTSTHGKIGFIKTPDYPCPQNGNDGSLSHGEWPFLNEASYGGRGAMRFGLDKDDSNRYSTLRSDTYTTNRTVILVFQWTKYDAGRSGGFWLWGMWGQQYLVGSESTSTDKNYLQNTAVTMGGNVWLNGEHLSDPTHTTLNERLFEWRTVATNMAGKAMPMILITECTEAIATSLGQKQGGHKGMYTELCLGSSSTYNTSGGSNYAFIDVAEFISYDRVLTEEERTSIEAELKFKWEEARRANEWTGAGQAGVWSDAANWGKGYPPELNSIWFGDFGSATTLDFAANAALAPICGGVTVNVSNGARLEFGEIDLNGRDLVVNGNGRIVGMSVTNSSATAAKVVLNAAAGETLVFDAAATANVAVEQTGAGTVKLCAGQQGAVALAAGELSVVSNIAPAAIAGLTLHLDASDADTLTVDADGYVRSWRSKSGNGLVFVPSSTSSIMPPVFTNKVVGKNGSTRLQVLGAVRFGAAPGEDLPANVAQGTTTTLLYGNVSIKHGTLFAVCEPLHRVSGTTAPYLYSSAANEADKRLILKAGRFGNWDTGGFLTGGRAWVNGLKEFDGSGDRFEYQNLSGYLRYHQVTAETGSILTFKPMLSGAGGNSIHGIVCEMIVYDRHLTDAERQYVERYLLDKWHISPQAAAALPGASSPLAGDFAVKGDATVDLNGMTQAVKSVTFVPVGAVYPVLNLAVGTVFDVTGADLVLEGGLSSMQSLVTHDEGGVVGPFMSVSGLASGCGIKYLATSVRLKPQSGLVINIK